MQNNEFENNENNNINNEVENKDDKINVKKEIFEWIQSIAIALIIALVIRTYVFTLVKVDGKSMYPTLDDGDRLVVTRLAYTPKNGDIIIFTPTLHKDTPYVKRVIGVEGQTVDINFNTGAVSVDGKILKENYINEITQLRGNVKFPVIVEKDCVFVLGDNRNHSRDSRFSDVFMVNKKTIMGKAQIRIFPFDSVGNLYK